MGLRTFIAIEISEEARTTLRALQRQLQSVRSDVRWEQPEKMHLTLKFLGDTPSERVPGIVARIDEIGKQTGACNLLLKGVGCFPNLRRPRVVWAGCENPDGRLAGLKSGLETALLQDAFEADRNPFHPHITLGRCRDGNAPGELISLLETVTFDPVSFITNDIVLMKSTLKPGGSEYSILHSIHLAG